MLNQLQAMRVFLKIAETNSFSRAATSLGLSNGAVTRYVVLLESHLNTRLINRTTRSASLTDAGRTFAQGCRQMLDLLETIESNVGHEARDPSGTLKLVAASSFSLVALAPIIKRFCERYPKVKVDLTLHHGIVDLVEEGFDVGLLTSRQLGPDLVIRKSVASLQSVVVGSPDYLHDHGEPDRPAALASRSVLLPSREIHVRTWYFANARGEEESVTVDACCTANDLVMLRQLALEHIGLAILPAAYVRNDIENGLLVPVLRDYEIRGGAKELVLAWSGRRPLAARIRCFVELALEYFETDFAAAIAAMTADDSSVDGLAAGQQA